MKPLFFFLSTLALCLSLAACGTSPAPQDPPAPPAAPEAPQEVTPAAIIKAAQLQYPAANDLFKYNVYDTYVEISAYIGPDDAEEVVVPAVLEGLPVYVVDSDVFRTCGVKSIVFEDGIYRINTGFSAGLVRVVLPATLDYVGSGTFENCYSLETVVLPEGIDSIQFKAFKHCHGLKEITIPSTVTRLSDETFAYCPALETVTLCEGLEVIEDEVFAGCEALKTLAIPSSVQALGRHVFLSSGLEHIDIPGSVRTVGSGLFTGCEALTQVRVYSDSLDIQPEEGYTVAMLFSQCSPDLVVHGKAGSAIAKQCAQEDIFFTVLQ